MRQCDVRDFSIGCYTADSVADRIGEPHCAVRARGYSFGESVGIDRKAFGRAVRSHPSDAVALELGEPQVAVGARRDRIRRMGTDRRAGGSWLRAWCGRGDYARWLRWLAWSF